MIEKLLCEQDKSQRAMYLLIKSFENYIRENNFNNKNFDRKDFVQNVFTFTYIMNLIVKDAELTTNNCYKKVHKKEYSGYV